MRGLASRSVLALVAARACAAGMPAAGPLLAGRPLPRALATMSAAAPPPPAAPPLPSAADVQQSVCETRARIDALTAELGLPSAPRLVAVSKTKPLDLVLAAHAAGQTHFGENYAQELIGKAAELQQRAPEIAPEIEWRYIGALQSNKCKALVAGVPNLACVETVDRPKVARALDSAVGDALGSGARAAAAGRLSVLLQLNTSGEAAKSGVEPAEAAALARTIAAECANLRLAGLMTIGAIRPDLPPDSPNPDFAALHHARRDVAAALGCAEAELELSMGMSGDWERAIRQGSTSVRVGSAIFGLRG